MKRIHLSAFALLAAISACTAGNDISHNTSAVLLRGALPLEAHAFLAELPSGKINGTSDKACIGEPFGLSVDISAADTAIYINGTPGRQRYMQFWVEGEQPITVMTRDKDGKVESATAWINVVTDCALLPEIVTAISRADPRELHFSVANADELVEDPAASGKYTWTVHDGSTVVATATTNYPTWTHRFDPDDIDYEQHFTQLVIDVEVDFKGGSRAAYRTFTLRPTYQMVRGLGTVQPPVSFDPLDWDAGLTIHNVDAHQALKFTEAELTFWSCTEQAAGEAPDSVVLPSAPEILIGSGKSQTISFHDIFGYRKNWDEEWETCGLGVRLLGELGGVPAEANAYVELRQFPFRLHEVENEEILAMLRDATARGLWPEDDTILTQRDLWRLEREGRIDALPGGLNENDEADVGDDLPRDRVLVSNEFRCDPNSPRPAPDGFDGWECLPTDEYEQSLPYIANAHAGDIPLSSGCGMVGTLLRQLSPAQRFSHTGIFTRSQDVIRHSTAAEARIHEGMGRISSQIQPRRLTYPQPGIISQSVLGAYDGARWLDTEFPDESYILDSFNDELGRCPGDHDPTPPLLLRWSHDLADAERVEALLQGASAMAGHYRFFSYSNGAIATDMSYDDPDAVVVGEDGRNRATVCSSFLWTAAHEAGLTLEAGCEDPSGVCADGVFEARDRAGCDGDAWGRGCAARDVDTLDGLYYYSPEERLAAGRALYADAHRLAGDETVLPGQRNQVANQVANCFALDKCSTYDGDGEDFGDGEWEQDLHAGRAVSPDDLLFWDAPYAGRTEPVTERQGFYRRIYAWQPALDSCEGTVECEGSIRATVRGPAGQLVPGASVDLHLPGTESSSLIATSSAAGQAVFGEVRQGRYEITATVFIDGTLYVGSAVAEVTARAESAVEIVVRESDEFHGDHPVGNLHVVATLYAYDADMTDRKSEEDEQTFEAWIDVSPFAPFDSRTLSLCVDNEVELRLQIDTTLQEDISSVVVLSAEIWEGNSCGDELMTRIQRSGISMLPGRTERWNTSIIAHEVGRNSHGTVDVVLEYERE